MSSGDHSSGTSEQGSNQLVESEVAVPPDHLPVLEFPLEEVYEADGDTVIHQEKMLQLEQSLVDYYNDDQLFDDEFIRSSTSYVKSPSQSCFISCDPIMVDMSFHDRMEEVDCDSNNRTYSELQFEQVSES